MEHKELELVRLMIKMMRGVRVGTDLELAELAVREERALRERLDRLEEAATCAAGGNTEAAA